MKKTTSLFLTALLCALLCACGVQAPTTLAAEIDLPSDGVIEAQTLKDLRENRQAVTLRGETDGVAYTWTLFGSEIETPRDCDFALTRIRLKDKKIYISFASKEAFGFAPLLTLFLPQMPDADVAAVYRVPAKEDNYVCAASVTTADPGGAVSFAVNDPTGSYVIELLRGETPLQTTAPSDEAPQTTTALTTQPAMSAPRTTAPAKAAPSVTPPTTTTAPATTRPTATAQTVTERRRTETTDAQTTATTTTTSVQAEPQTTTCTFSIECGTVFQHLADLEAGKLDALPPNGVMLPAQSVDFTAGESVFDVLQRVCRENGIPMEASFVPLYQSAYVEGIGNLYEFDCGEGSGWMYRVNGSYPNYGCSRCILRDGDTVEFRYTCDLGADIGGKNNYS